MHWIRRHRWNWRSVSLPSLRISPLMTHGRRTGWLLVENGGYVVARKKVQRIKEMASHRHWL